MGSVVSNNTCENSPTGMRRWGIFSDCVSDILVSIQSPYLKYLLLFLCCCNKYVFCEKNMVSFIHLLVLKYYQINKLFLFFILQELSFFFFLQIPCSALQINNILFMNNRCACMSQQKNKWYRYMACILYKEDKQCYIEERLSTTISGILVLGFVGFCFVLKD